MRYLLNSGSSLCSSFLRYPLTPVSPCRTFCCSRYRYCNSEAELILSLSNTQLITTNGFRGDNFAGVSSSFFSDEKSQVWNCELDELVSHMPLSPNDCIITFPISMILCASLRDTFPLGDLDPQSCRRWD